MFACRVSLELDGFAIFRAFRSARGVYSLEYAGSTHHDVRVSRQRRSVLFI